MSKNDKFVLRSDGIYVIQNDREKRICSPIEIEAITRDEQGNNWGRLLCWIDRDNKTHRKSLPMTTLLTDPKSGLSTLIDEGFEVEPGSFNHVANFITSRHPTTRMRSVQQIGWHSGCYVLPSETIQCLRRNENFVYQSKSRTVSLFHTAGNLAAWQEKVGNLCAGNSLLVLVTAFALTPVFLKAIGEESFGIHLFGTSSCGKTSSLKVAGSIWGGGSTNRGFMQTWSSTANGLTAIAAQHNDALLVLDEISQVDPRNVGDVVYQLANSTGKQRSDRMGDARARTEWTMGFLSSGEKSLEAHMAHAGRTIQAGQEIRLINLEVGNERFGCFETCHNFLNGELFSFSLSQNSLANYGCPARNLIEHIVKDPDLPSIVASLKKKIQNKWRFIRSDGQENRVRAKFATIAAVGEIAIQLGILPFKKLECYRASRKYLKRWISSRDGRGNSEQFRIISHVKTTLESNATKRFAHLNETNGSDNRPLSEIWGYYRESQYNDGFHEYIIISGKFKEICGEFEPRIVKRVLGDAKVIERDSEGKYSVVRSVPGIKRSRYVVIKGRIFDVVCEMESVQV